jgi:hypothetical protein
LLERQPTITRGGKSEQQHRQDTPFEVYENKRQKFAESRQYSKNAPQRRNIFRRECRGYERWPEWEFYLAVRHAKASKGKKI